jgi:C-terminal processing protease CtpA/Prc
MKAYVEATGDRYAAYYNAEEYKALLESNAGTFQGIGLNVIYSTVNYEGGQKKVIKIVNVVENSPRMKPGLR